MAHYQNQYGAVPVSKDPIQKEMDITGDTTGTGVGGGGTQVIADHEHGTATNTSSSGSVMGAEGEEQHHHKKGIIEKIKEKLPGTRHHDHNNK